MLRNDRNRNGGGVALYVHNTLKAEVLAISNTTTAAPVGTPDKPEYLICSVQQRNDTPILVAVVYRPPHVAFLKDSDLVEKLETCVEDFSHKIIMGDLNANLLSTTDDAKFVKNLAKDLSLKMISTASRPMNLTLTLLGYPSPRMDAREGV